MDFSLHVLCLMLSSFQWYLENVYPEQFVPTKAVYTGVIRSATEGLCLTTPKGKKKDLVHKPVLSLPCKEYRNSVWNEQIWQFSGRKFCIWLVVASSYKKTVDSPQDIGPSVNRH